MHTINIEIVACTHIINIFTHKKLQFMKRYILIICVLFCCISCNDYTSNEIKEDEPIQLTPEEFLSISNDKVEELDESQIIELLNNFSCNKEEGLILTKSKFVKFTQTNKYYLDINPPNNKLRYSSTDQIPFYEFEIDGEEKGCALVCADSRMPTVLAYVPKGSFSDTIFNKGFKYMVENCKNVARNSIHGIRYFQDSLREQTIEKIKNRYNLVDFDFEKVKSKITIEEPLHTKSTTEEYIGPLTTTAWHQGYPYNLQCPSSSGCQHTVAGCVAIAIAQTIAYYEPQYDPSITIPWTEIKANRGISNSTHINIVSSLVRGIGDITNMKYGCNGSGTSLMEYGFDAIKHYGLDKKMSGTQIRPKSYTIRESLQMGLICLMRGESGDEGHAWIVDGLKTVIVTGVKNSKSYNYYMSCNFGWGNTSAESGWFTEGDGRANYPIIWINDFRYSQGYISAIYRK